MTAAAHPHPSFMSPSSMHYRRYVTGLQDPISREGRGQIHRAVQCREAKRRCTVAPRHQRKYTRLWSALGWERYLLNQPRRHITAQPRTPPVPATNSVAPLPLRLPRPVSSVQVPRREDRETASIQTLYTHRRGGSPPPSLENTNNKPKLTTPTSQNLNSTRQHQAEPSSCLLPPWLPMSRLPVSYPPPSISVIPAQA